MKYTVDAALCCGHGLCYGGSPEVYAANDAGENLEIGNTVEIPAGLEAAAKLGASRCPEAAIEIFD